MLSYKTINFEVDNYISYKSNWRPNFSTSTMHALDVLQMFCGQSRYFMIGTWLSYHITAKSILKDYMFSCKTFNFALVSCKVSYKLIP